MTADTNTKRYVSYSLGPDGFVEFRIDSDVGRLHLLLGKLLDGFYCSRRAPLEAYAMDVLVKMDGVLTSHHFFQSRPSLFVSLSRHLLPEHVLKERLYRACALIAAL